MCTVSFVNGKNGLIITSNRDEKILRGTALEPSIVNLCNKKILYPKDSKAGGTWFAVDDHNNVAVLLNGAEEKHISTGNYIKSRGLILLEIISADNPLEYLQNIDLKGIEPFTVILFFNGNLFQMRWNEKENNIQSLDVNKNYIWSSSTLYSKEIISNREKWFNEFMEKKAQPHSIDLENFHEHTNSHDKTNGLVIERDNVYKTLSITQAFIQENYIDFIHKDLLLQHKTEIHFAMHKRNNYINE
jgi:hypothetical protein